MRRYQQVSGVLFALIAGAQSTGTTQAPAGAPLNAKLGETLLGPKTQRMVMSEDGDHLAIVTPKGSREIVVVDGRSTASGSSTWRKPPPTRNGTR